MSANPSRYVLDSHAVIAYIESEAGAPRVETLLTQAEKNQSELYFSIVNFGEVIYITERETGLVAAHSVIAAIDELPLTIVEADRKHTFSAAHFKAKYPISYADAFALALAQSLDAKLVTGDPEFRIIGDVVEIEWLAAK